MDQAARDCRRARSMVDAVDRRLVPSAPDRLAYYYMI